VALLLEGTYPYVRGGVASWVHELVSSLPETSFHLVFLGGASSDQGAAKFELPPNVRGITHHYLFEPSERPLRSRREWGGPGAVSPLLAQVLGGAHGLGLADLRADERAWQQIRRGYMEDWEGGSFLDYFWTIRTMHASLVGLSGLVERLPEVRAVHAISTGYAGFLGALLARRRGVPLVLTEHGIYTKERKIDLASAERLPGDDDRRPGLGVGRRLWIRFFEGLGRIAYEASEVVISLYESNRQRQIQDGAVASRTRIVPNGIDVERFRPLRAARAAEPPPVLGLIGRVVPIKDVMTFIRAMKTVTARLPGAEGWIVGPTSEDEEYASECMALVTRLGLDSNVRFLGFRRPEEILPSLGLLVLTSASEALPLVILEAWASGLPVLSTDVGACRDLVEGNGPEDRAMGVAGSIAPVGDPHAIAAAAVDLLQDRPRWRAAQEAGIRRVESSYTLDRMVGAYRQVYQEAL
jgi:glycosyltransferase involved in cell wall biosynthesis